MVLQPSRFEQTLFNKHKGDIDAFLNEFRSTFIRWSTNIDDTEALNRWNDLLQTVYNAGESGIAKAPQLFPDLIDLLLMQFNQLPETMLTKNTFVTHHARYLAEDMIDSGIEIVVEKGQIFESYLQQKGLL
jgi:AAR2 protein